MTKLTGPRRAARSGTTRSLVILLHGYGADGNDLIGLADPLGPHMPDTVFLSPNAPEPCRAAPTGRQWFPISWLDGCPEAEMKAGFAKSADLLEGWLAETMEAEGVTPAQTALVGFSQGTMMSLEVAPRLTDPLSCVVGFSGRLAREPGTPASKPPILLVHGDMDEMIPVTEMESAREQLAAAGFSVRWHVSQGTGHGIAPDGLGLALGFMKSHLGGAG